MTSRTELTVQKEAVGTRIPTIHNSMKLQRFHGVTSKDAFIKVSMKQDIIVGINKLGMHIHQGCIQLSNKIVVYRLLHQ